MVPNSKLGASARKADSSSSACSLDSSNNCRSAGTCALGIVTLNAIVEPACRLVQPNLTHQRYGLEPSDDVSLEAPLSCSRTSQTSAAARAPLVPRVDD